MKKGILFISCVLFLIVSFQLGCDTRKDFLVGIAEDPSDTVSSIYQSLSNGRKLALEMDSSNKTTVKMIEMNSQNDPENTANLFRQFYQENTSGIMLGTPSVECAQVAKYIAQSYHRTFLCNAYESTIPDNVDTTVLFNQNPFYQGKLLVRYIFDKMDKRRVCVVYDTTNPLYSSMHDGIVAEGNSIGVTVMEVPMEGKKNLDPNRIFAKVSSSNPECIVVLTDSSLTNSFLLTAKNDFHIFTPFFFPVIPEDYKSISVQGEIYFFTPFFEKKPSFLSSVFYQQYLAKFNSEPSYFAVLGFDEIVFLQTVASNNNFDNWNEIYKNLKGMSIDNTLFLTGLRGFSEDGFALKPIDIIELKSQQLVYKETYWHSLTKSEL